AVRGARRYGTKLGKAFQIHDDVLDLVSEPGKTGKARASDLIEGKTTLVSIHARRQGVETRLPDDASPDEIDEKIEEIRDAGSIEYARERARRLADESKRELTSLPDGEARDLLVEIADYAVEREN
ncbi:MAG: polyprenyl synthetase family protein, partial [Halobacteria archaeon]|nr:polyprenyl synthetase family protein [Halobacteria archaeon]